MYPLTHSVAALAASRLLPDRWLPRGQVPRAAVVATALAAGNAADLDALSLGLGGVGSYVAHGGGVLHSVWAAAAFALAFGGLAGRLWRTPWRPLAVVGALAAASHLVLDALTFPGFYPFAPLGGPRLALAWLFPVDPAFLLLLTAAWWLRPRRWRPVAVPLLLAAYVGLGAAASRHAEAVGWQSGDMAGVDVQEVVVTPSPGVASALAAPTVDVRGPSFDARDSIDLLAPGSSDWRRRPTNLQDPAVRALLSTRAGRIFARWAVAPVARVETTPWGTGWVLVTLSDARWDFPGLGPMGPSLVAWMRERGTRHLLDGLRWRLGPPRADEHLPADLPAPRPPYATVDELVRRLPAKAPAGAPDAPSEPAAP